MNKISIEIISTSTHTNTYYMYILYIYTNFRYVRYYVTFTD